MSDGSSSLHPQAFALPLRSPSYAAFVFFYDGGTDGPQYAIQKTSRHTSKGRPLGRMPKRMHGGNNGWETQESMAAPLARHDHLLVGAGGNCRGARDSGRDGL